MPFQAWGCEGRPGLDSEVHELKPRRHLLQYHTQSVRYTVTGVVIPAEVGVTCGSNV